jgi:hypothetical protein
MSAAEEPTIERLFVNKPHNLALFKELRKHIADLDGIKEIITNTQVSFGEARKFAWLWLAPATKKTPEGVLMLTLDMTHPVEHTLINSVEETYPGKWTHQIAVKDRAVLEQILDHGWIKEAYKFGTRMKN